MPQKVYIIWNYREDDSKVLYEVYLDKEKCKTRCDLLNYSATEHDVDQSFEIESIEISE